MFIPKRIRDMLPKNKSKDELDEHYKNVKLEKGDFWAMVIAAFITFIPVLIIVMVIVYGLMWILLLR